MPSIREEGAGGGATTFQGLTDTPANYTGQSGKTVTVKAAEDGVEFTTPAGGGDMLVATYDPASKSEQLLGISDIVTTVGSPGSDAVVPSEQGVREALDAIGDKTVKATFFAVIASGTTTGSITKPAGGTATLVMDEWGTDTDALLSTINNGKPTFKSPVDSSGDPITTTFDTAGNYTFSATPVPAAQHALIYVYTCKLSDFLSAEALWESELLGNAVLTTDFDATSFLYATSKNTPENKTPSEVRTILNLDQDVSSSSSPTFDGANITGVKSIYADVKEANVSAVKKGQTCAIVGSSGEKFEVQLCDCNDAALIRILGFAVADTNQNAVGTVVYKGVLTNVDTRTTNTYVNPNGETWAAGDMLFASTTPGGLTNVRPTSGRCIKAGRTLKGSSETDTLIAIVHTNDICACAAAGENLCNRMGDSAGVNKIAYRDYANNEVAALDSNGNLILIGTVDGRDIATDGTKLDGIETSADVTDTVNVDASVTRVVVVKCIADGTALTTGDGKMYFTVPIELNGMNLISVGGHIYTSSSSGLPTFQIYNLTDAVDMLSTLITIDATENDSKDAATPPVINTTNDDVATGDVLRFDCDVAGTGADGMEIRMGFRLP